MPLSFVLSYLFFISTGSKRIAEIKTLKSAVDTKISPNNIEKFANEIFSITNFIEYIIS